MHSEASWSLIDPRPVVRYLPQCDEYIVYWNGVVIPHLMALNLMTEYFNIFPSPEMKKMLLNNYRKIYYANGLGCRDWDQMVEEGRVYNYLRRLMAPHIATLKETRTESEMLEWFNYDRAICNTEDNHDYN